MARSAGVSSDPQIRSYRRLREDEKAVCSSWSRHAAKCRYCCNPSDVWRRNGQLCDRGRMYAIDVAKYIYSKGGRPHSVIDKAAYGQRNEIEIPVEYEAVRELVRAFDKGLTLSAKKPVISQDPHYYVKSRDARYYNVDITPSSRRERERYHDDSNRRKTVHFSDDTYRGSLFYADEQAKRDRRRYDDEPVIVLAEPRRSSKYYQ